MFQEKCKTETEIQEWVQKYDTDMTEKQVLASGALLCYERFAQVDSCPKGHMALSQEDTEVRDSSASRCTTGKGSLSCLCVQESSAALALGKVTSTAKSHSIWGKWVRLGCPPHARKWVFQFCSNPQSSWPYLMSQMLLLFLLKPWGMC